MACYSLFRNGVYPAGNHKANARSPVISQQPSGLVEGSPGVAAELSDRNPEVSLRSTPGYSVVCVSSVAPLNSVTQ